MFGDMFPAIDSNRLIGCLRFRKFGDGVMTQVMET